MSQIQGTLYTISAPSGAGKTSLVKALLDRSQNLQVSVSHTTRPMRPGERNGINYQFVNVPTFQALLEQGDFLEHARVFDHWYGTSRQWVEETLRHGIDVILEIDWQGAAQIREQLTQTVSIFILPPSRDALSRRLTDRDQDDPGIIAQRMQQASNEMAHYTSADYLVINDVFERALHDLNTIVDAQRLRLCPQRQRHHQLLAELLD